MKKILVAEDNDSNYVLMTYMLKDVFELERAHNGEEALEKLSKDTFHLVLMDLKMPLMDGLEATRRIKALYPDMPVVVVTANAFDTDKQSAKEAGCDDFLSKPINQKKCIETIMRLAK